MRYLIASSLLLILLLLSWPVVLSIVVPRIPQNVQPGLDRTEYVHSENMIEFTVVSEVNNLSAIGVSVKNPQLLNKKDLILSIRDENGNSIATSVLNGSVISDGDLVKFKFDPIPDSANKYYKMTFSSPESTPPDSFQIFLTHDLVPSFILYTTPEKRLSLAKNIYKGWLDHLLADKTFTVAYTLLILCGLMLLLRYHLTEKQN